MAVFPVKNNVNSYDLVAGTLGNVGGAVAADNQDRLFPMDTTIIPSLTCGVAGIGSNNIITGISSNLDASGRPMLNVNVGSDIQQQTLQSTSISATSSNVTLYTAPLGKRTFVTKIFISYLCDAACDNLYLDVNMNCLGYNTSATRVLIMQHIAATAASKEFSQDFKVPVEILENTPIRINATFAAGNLSAYVVIFGYTIPAGRGPMPPITYKI